MQRNNNYTNEESFVERVLQEASLPRNRRDGQNFVDIRGYMRGSGNRYHFCAQFNNSSNDFENKRVSYDEVVLLDFDDKEAPELSDYMESLARKIRQHTRHPSVRYVEVKGDRILVPSLQYLVETQGLPAPQKQIA